MNAIARRTLPLLAALLIPACDDDDDADVGPAPASDGRSAGGDDALPARLSAALGGGQIFPSVAGFGEGTATFFIPSDRERVDFSLEVSGLSGPATAQVRLGGPGAEGPVLFDLATTPFASPHRGTLRAGDLRPQPGAASFDDALNAMIEGRTHVSVGTLARPGGEIRGQIGPATFRAALSGAQAVPPLPTPGSGAATLELNASQTELTFALDVSGLSGPPTSARIHAGPPGLNGPPFFDLATTMFDGPLRGVLTAADLRPQPRVEVVDFADAVDTLLSGDAYVLVATAAFPNGELRGQLLPFAVPAPVPQAAPIVPPAPTPAPEGVSPFVPAATAPPFSPATTPVSPFAPPTQGAGPFVPAATTPPFSPATTPVSPFAPPTQGESPFVPAATTPPFSPATAPGAPTAGVGPLVPAATAPPFSPATTPDSPFSAPTQGTSPFVPAAASPPFSPVTTPASPLAPGPSGVSPFVPAAASPPFSPATTPAAGPLAVPATTPLFSPATTTVIVPGLAPGLFPAVAP